jgi:CheY-like chemotaxis protein
MNRRLLIIDDNPSNLRLLDFLLKKHGYDVRTAMDAKAAIAELAAFSPGLILVDLQMPGQDGFELTRQLKADPATRDITIVAVTAYAMRGDEDKARAAGCDGYITKPIDTRTLPGLIAEYLSSRSGESP